MEIPAEYAKLREVVTKVDDLIQEIYPDFFGKNSSHPVLPVKRSKIIHDSIWGTSLFNWQELGVIDSPILQRLRDIHQLGLAYLVYPSGQHTRFEHSLGTAIVASRVFDNLRSRNELKLRQLVEAAYPKQKADWESILKRIHAELRMAALLHDSGHALFSHASESVYARVPEIQQAAADLTRLVGKKRNAGELLSFAIAQSKGLQMYLARCGARVDDGGRVEARQVALDFDNISLLIVGRSCHPHLQFLGDIVSSGFDADKLDYLIRDATACGLAITYDIERYMAFVKIHNESTEEKSGELRSLFEKVLGVPDLEASAIISGDKISLYRLRLPAEAITCVEQVVIDKFMLYSYLYHHAKVRAAEVVLERALSKMLGIGNPVPPSLKEVLKTLFLMTDSRFLTVWQDDAVQDSELRESSYRLYARLLPRVIYSLGGRVGDPEEKAALATFIGYMDSPNRAEIIRQLEEGIGVTLVATQAKTEGGPRWSKAAEALHETGGWVDAPKPLSFEDKEVLLPTSSPDVEPASLSALFPIDKWAKAYLNHVYRVRVYAYSEYASIVSDAGKTALRKALGIHDDVFYDAKIKRRRSLT